MPLILLITGIIIVIPIVIAFFYAMYLSYKDKDDHAGHIIAAVIITAIAMTLFGLN